MAKLLTMLNENHQEKNSTLKSSPNLTVLNLHSRMIFTTSLRHSVLSTVFMSDWTTPRLPRCLVGKRGDWKKYCEGLHQSTKEIKSRCCFERSETALVAKHPLEPKSTLTGSRWLTLTNDQCLQDMQQTDGMDSRLNTNENGESKTSSGDSSEKK
jgi:hypothetical protein